MNIFKVICLLLLIPATLFCQKGWELGGQVGVSHYLGDLNTNYDLTELGVAGGVHVRYNFGHRICLKGSLNYGWIYADDKDSPNQFEQTRNLDFRSHLGDLSGVLEFNFLPYTHGSYYEYFTPYLFMGGGLAYFNPYTFLDDEKHFLRPLGTEGQTNGQEYLSFTPTFLIGGGMKWDINYKWSINIEYGMRHTFTDYLDDVSGTYADPNTLLSQRGETAVLLADRSGEANIGKLGRQRGDVNRRDRYGFLTVGVMRYFGSVQCPRISKSQAEKWL